MGQLVKIGDASKAAYGYTTTEDNAYVRITTIAANALTLDDLPSG